MDARPTRAVRIPGLGQLALQRTRICSGRTPPPGILTVRSGHQAPRREVSSSRARRHLLSGGWKCAVVGVPWRGSVSVCLARGELFCQKRLFSKSAEKAEPSKTPWHTFDGITDYNCLILGGWQLRAVGTAGRVLDSFRTGSGQTGSPQKCRNSP